MPYFRIRVSQSHSTTYHIHIEGADGQAAKQLVLDAHAAGDTSLVSGLYRVEDSSDENTEVVRMPDDGEIYRAGRVNSALKDL